MSNSNQRFPIKYKIFIVLIVVGAALHLAGTNGYIGVGGDNCYYITLGQSLASNYSYNEIFKPNAPPHIQYPPLFPLIIAFQILLIGNYLLLFKLTNIVLGIFTTYFIYRLILQINPNKTIAGMTAIIYLFSARIYISTHQIQSEAMYLFVSFLTLYVFTKYFYLKKDNKYFAVLFGLLLVIVYLTRSIGVSMIAGFVFYYLFSNMPAKYGKQNLKNLTIVVCVFIIPAILWKLRNNMVSVFSLEYSDFLFLEDSYDLDAGTIGFLGIAYRVINNFVAYVQDIGNSLFLTQYVFEKIYLPPSFIYLINILITCACLVGFGICLYKKRTIIDFYFVIYMGILLIWPFQASVFLTPVLPIMIYYVIYTLSIIYSYRSTKNKKIVYILLSLFVILTLAVNSSAIAYYLVKGKPDVYGGNWIGYYLRNEIYYEKSWRDFYDVSKWAGSNLNEDSLIISRKPELTYMWTGLKSDGYLFTNNFNKQLTYLRKTGNYLIVDGVYDTTSKYIAPFVNNNDNFILLHEINNTKLFKIKRE